DAGLQYQSANHQVDQPSRVPSAREALRIRDIRYWHPEIATRIKVGTIGLPRCSSTETKIGVNCYSEIREKGVTMPPHILGLAPASASMSSPSAGSRCSSLCPLSRHLGYTNGLNSSQGDLDGKDFKEDAFGRVAVKAKI